MLQPDLYIKNVLASTERKPCSVGQEYQTNISYVVNSSDKDEPKMGRFVEGEQKRENVENEEQTEEKVSTNFSTHVNIILNLYIHCRLTKTSIALQIV